MAELGDAEGGGLGYVDQTDRLPGWFRTPCRASGREQKVVEAVCAD